MLKNKGITLIALVVTIIDIIILKMSKLNGGGKKMNFKKKGGITLIALVVTIIVLLILARH